MVKWAPMTNLSITKASFWPVKCRSMGIGWVGLRTGIFRPPGQLENWAGPIRAKPTDTRFGKWSHWNYYRPGKQSSSRTSWAEPRDLLLWEGHMPSTCLHPHLVSLQPFLGPGQLTPWSWWARRPTTVERDVSPQNMCIRRYTAPSLATDLGMWPSHRLIKCLDQGRTTDAWVPYPGVSPSVLKCLTGEGAPVFCSQQMQLKFKSMDVHLIPLSFNHFELEVSVRRSSIYIPW